MKAGNLLPASFIPTGCPFGCTVSFVHRHSPTRKAHNHQKGRQRKIPRSNHAGRTVRHRNRISSGGAHATWPPRGFGSGCPREGASPAPPRVRPHTGAPPAAYDTGYRQEWHSPAEQALPPGYSNSSVECVIPISAKSCFTAAFTRPSSSAESITTCAVSAFSVVLNAHI